MTLVFLAALLAVNLALRSWPVRQRDEDALTVLECAFLRGGTHAAVLTALATLHLRVREEGPDPFEEADPLGQAEPFGEAEPFEEAVADVGDPPTGTWGIASNRAVRRAAGALRESLVARGLLAPTGHWVIARCALVGVPLVAILGVDGPIDLTIIVGSAVAVLVAGALWLAPRRTIAGWRVLRAERRRYERVTLADPAAARDAGAFGMLVALHGRPALDLLTEPPPEGPEPEEEPEPEGPEPDEVAPPVSPLTPRRLTL